MGGAEWMGERERVDREIKADCEFGVGVGGGGVNGLGEGGRNVASGSAA